MGITVEDFYKFVDPMRDLSIWSKDEESNWVIKDAVWMHPETDRELNASVIIDVDNHIFTDNNRHLYYNDLNIPSKIGDRNLDVPSDKFQIF